MSIKVRVYHALYGCESGCCGHIVELGGDVDAERFEFTHPYGVDFASWARIQAEEVIRRYYPECLSTIDWSSLDFEGVSDE